MEEAKLFREYVLDLTSIDQEKSEEITYRNLDLLKTVGVKYLFEMRNYSRAAQIYKELRDPEVKGILSHEAEILKTIEKEKGNL